MLDLFLCFSFSCLLPHIAYVVSVSKKKLMLCHIIHHYKFDLMNSSAIIFYFLNMKNTIFVLIYKMQDQQLN